jgi:hypothetical protein
MVFILLTAIFSLPAIAIIAPWKQVALLLAIPVLVGLSLLWVWFRSASIILSTVKAKKVADKQPLGMAFQRIFPSTNRHEIHLVDDLCPVIGVVNVSNKKTIFIVFRGLAESTNEKELSEHFMKLFKSNKIGLTQSLYQACMALRLLIDNLNQRPNLLVHWLLRWILSPVDRLLLWGMKNYDKESLYGIWTAITKTRPDNVFSFDFDSSIASTR